MDYMLEWLQMQLLRLQPFQMQLFKEGAYVSDRV